MLLNIARLRILLLFQMMYQNVLNSLIRRILTITLIQKSEFEYVTIYQNQQEDKTIELPFAATRTAKFTSVVNTLPITATNLQNPTFRRINEIDVNIIAGEEQFNSVQFDNDNDKFQAWSLLITYLEYCL